MIKTIAKHLINYYFKKNRYLLIKVNNVSIYIKSFDLGVLKRCYIQYKGFFINFLIFSFFYFSTFSIYCQDFEKDLKKGVKLNEKGSFNEAIEIFKEIEKDNLSKLNKTEKIWFYVDCAKSYNGKADYISSLEYLLKAKSINVNDSLNYQNIYNSTFAELFFNLNAYDLSINYYKRYVSNKISPIQKYHAYNRIGTLYLHIYNFEEALKYFNAQYDMSSDFNEKIWHESALNNIALVEYKQKKYKESLNKFLKVLDNLDKKNIKDENFKLTVNSNIGRTYYYLKDFKNSIKYFEKSLLFDINDSSLYQNFYFQSLLGKAYINNNEIEKANNIVKKISPIYNKLSTVSKLDFNVLRIAIYNHFNNKEKLEIINEEQQKLIIFQLNKENRIKSNLSANIVSKYLIYEAKQKILIEKKEKENSKKELSLNKRENYFITSIVISLFIISLIGIYILFQKFKNDRNKAILEKEKLKLDEEKLKHRIKTQKTNLTEFAIDINFKNEYNKELLAKLKEINSLDDIKQSEAIKKLIFELKSKENNSANISKLNEESELILLQFKNKLGEKHPNLSKSEIDLCMYISLNLSNKQISQFKNISDTSVKTLKNRLKKNLGLTQNDNLNDYLAELNKDIV